MHTKIPLLLTPLSVALACPQPTWAPGCLVVPDLALAAGGTAEQRLFLAGSSAAPCPVLPGAEPRGCPRHRQTGCRIPAPGPLRPRQDSRSWESRSSSFWLSMALRCCRYAQVETGLRTLRDCSEPAGESRDQGWAPASGWAHRSPLQHLWLSLPTFSITTGSSHGSPFTASCLTH